MTNSICDLGRMTLSLELRALIPRGLVEMTVTYFIHSTLLIGAVWLATQLARWRDKKTQSVTIPPGTEERLWKLAIVLGLFTSLGSIVVGLSHPVWECSLR